MVLKPTSPGPAQQAFLADTLVSVGNSYYSFAFGAMGTVCQVDFDSPTRGAAASFERQVKDWVDAFERRFSRFLPDSLVSEINRRAGLGWVDIDSEAELLFSLCDWFYWKTRGIFDPTILPLLTLWDYHRRDATPPAWADVQDALRRIGWARVQRRPGALFLPQAGMGLDLGGIGKEYAVDRVAEMGLARGIRSLHVNFGHDLRVHGEPPGKGPWRVGLEDPSRPGRCWMGLAVTDMSVTTSGNYLRYFEFGGRRYGHILDPRTGWPVDNACQAVTAIAPTCTEAGILSTTAFILGPTEGLDFLGRHYGTEGCLWTEGNITTTRGFSRYVLPKHQAA